MAMFFHYWRTEQRRALVVVAKSIRYFLGFLLLFTVAVFLCSWMFRDSKVLSKVEVAVVIPQENGEELELLTSFASTMQSVKSVCNLRYLDEAEAMELLRQGQLQAVLVFSEHFYQDVDYGRDTSVRLYVPEEMSPPLRTFQELLEDGISMLWTTESGVSSVLGQAKQARTRIAYSDIGLQVAIGYIETIFDRGQLYRNTVCSPYGVYGQAEYYFSSGMLLLLLVVGISFSHLYQKRSRALEEKLRIYGMNGWKISAAKVFTMANVMMLFVLIICVGGCTVTYILNLSFLFWDIHLFPGLYLLCLAFAVWYHVIYMAAKQSMTGTLVLLAVEMVVVLGSGLVVPLDYLPEFMKGVGQYLPLYQWHRFSLNLLFALASFSEWMGMVGWIMAGCAAGVLAVCKRD